MSEVDLWGGPEPAANDNSRFYGMTVGVVTNNQDPENLGRVKVKFPWLAEDIDSPWARVVTPMAGKERGIYFLPEVDDEVLVAFEHGMMDFPYILGALWNGQEKPPATNADGSNNVRLIKSRSGHEITLDDTAGEEKIIIRDKTAKNEIVIDSAANTLTVNIDGDVTIAAKGTLALSSRNGDVTIECNSFSIQAKQQCDMSAEQQITLASKAQLTLKGPAGVNINDGALEVM